MKSNLLKHVFFIIIALLPLVYLAAVWNTIPAIVPTHFDGSFKPDDFGHKSSLWLMAGILSGVSILSYFMLQFINKIDPKRASKPASPAFNKTAMLLVVFFAAINLLLILISINNTGVKDRALLPLLGLFFVFMGYIMRDIKPNYFVGIKVPWTLHSDYNWKKTHSLAGKLWVVLGLALTILSLVLPLKVGAYTVPVFVGIMVLVPIIYSFVLFKKELAHPEIANNNITETKD